MLSHLRVDATKRKVINLPEGWTTLFLAKTDALHPFLYAAVICPRESASGEIGDQAKIILFAAENIRTYNVLHGHKYPQSGGMVEAERSERCIIWNTCDECGHTEIFGVRIPVADILIAL